MAKKEKNVEVEEIELEDYGEITDEKIGTARAGGGKGSSLLTQVLQKFVDGNPAVGEKFVFSDFEKIGITGTEKTQPRQLCANKIYGFLRDRELHGKFKQRSGIRKSDGVPVSWIERVE